MFSVIIPAYNAEKFIAKAIESVLNQTYPEFELIIVDDGSRDHTSDVVRGYQDVRVRYIYQENGGVSAARNAGIRAAGREYVCFLDADDEWRENHLQVLCDLIGSYPDCAFFVTGYDIRLTNGQLIHKSAEILSKVKEETFRSRNGYDLILNCGYFLNTNTVCCRRTVFDKVGLFEVGVKNTEDDDMWFRIFAYYSIAVSKKATTVYNRLNSSATEERKVVHSVFLKRVDGILNSDEVPEERKQSLIRYVERKKISMANQYLLAGQKKEAIKSVLGANFSLVSKKYYLRTVAALFVPCKLLRKRIEKRDKGYYQEV